MQAHVPTPPPPPPTQAGLRHKQALCKSTQGHTGEKKGGGRISGWHCSHFKQLDGNAQFKATRAVILLYSNSQT